MSDRYIPEHRRNQFKAKNAFKPEELRRRREEAQVEIRKAKREENLAKRRGIGSGDQRPGASLGAAPDSDDESAPTESQVCYFPFLSSVIQYASLARGKIRFKSSATAFNSLSDVIIEIPTNLSSISSTFTLPIYIELT